MVFERAMDEFVGTECIKECKIWLGEERMEEVSESKYLETVLCKHETMEGAVNGRQVIGTLEREL